MSEKNSNFTLRIQHSDLTKAIETWFREGLGITKDNMVGYIEEAIKPIVDRFLEAYFTSDRLEKIIHDFIRREFIRTQLCIGSKKISSIHDMTEALISIEAKRCVQDTVRRIADEYLTITYSPKKDNPEEANG